MRQRIRFATIIPLLLITSLLTACGFQLRGQMDLNSDLARIAVSGNDIQFVRQLSKALNQNDIEVVETAAYRLRVLNVREQTGRQTQSSAGRYERQLTLTAIYQLETSDGLILFKPVELSNSRYIIYNQNEANSAQSEENVAYNELKQELVYTSVRRVAGISQEKLEIEVTRARKVQQMELEQNAEESQ